ncbi:hypothetical protein DPEC_G00114690 [Dallia pectoralis]|uniref:Uncharacterized protein n=1 Tax=Dallia pectoralis TaxID=75939 RepID=A0ACC2GUT2_DALPE|nr:hypothetical protein DPEC_G00114690 [Dallia pectoralis]
MRRSLAKVAKILIGTWAIMDSPIPLSSLRLLVPPLRLMSAFMWQVSQQRAIKHYGKLEEFVTVVTQTVPELMTDRQRTLLILGLRARVTLGRFSAEHPVSLRTLLYRIKSSQLTQVQSNDAGMESPEADFAKLTQNLILDPVEREHFVQVVFLEEFRPDFDKALQELVCDFLTRLEELLTLPDFKQTALLLSAGSSGLDECLQSFSHSEDLQFLLQNYKQCRTLYTNISSTDIPQESDIESDAFPDQLNRPNQDIGVGMRTSHLVAMESTRDIIGCDETCDEGNEDDIDVEEESAQKRAGSGVSPVSVMPGGDTDAGAGMSFQVLTPLSSASNECPPSTSGSSQINLFHQCPQCGKCFNYQSQLVQHQQIHCGDNPYKCSNCGNRFKFYTSLSNHKRMQCIGTAFSCAKCWREFGSLREKLRHQCPHNDVMYICPQSGKSFKSSPQYPFQCRHCARSFPESGQLETHEKTHDVVQTLDCHKCGVTFNNLPSLVSHVEAHKRWLAFTEKTGVLFGLALREDRGQYSLKVSIRGHCNSVAYFNLHVLSGTVEDGNLLSTHYKDETSVIWADLLLRVDPGHLDADQRLQLVATIANYLRMDPGSVRLLSLRSPTVLQRENTRVCRQSLSNAEATLGQGSQGTGQFAELLWPVGCRMGEQLSDLAQILEHSTSSAGRLAHLLGVPTLGWRVLCKGSLPTIRRGLEPLHHTATLTAVLQTPTPVPESVSLKLLHIPSPELSNTLMTAYTTTIVEETAGALNLELTQVLGTYSATGSMQLSVSGPSNLPPTVFQSIPPLMATVGFPFHFTIPPWTFRDPEDGAADSLVLELSFVDGPPVSWVALDGLVLHGVPLEVDLRFAPQQLLLVARDNQGLSAWLPITLDLQRSPAEPCHIFSLTAHRSLQSFLRQRHRVELLLNKLARFFNDSGSRHLAVLSLAPGSTIVSWYNFTLCQAEADGVVGQCPVGRIETMWEEMSSEIGQVSPEFSRAMQPEFPISNKSCECKDGYNLALGVVSPRSHRGFESHKTEDASHVPTRSSPGFPEVVAEHHTSQWRTYHPYIYPGWI